MSKSLNFTQNFSVKNRVSFIFVCWLFFIDGTTGACIQTLPVTTTTTEDPCQRDKERLNEEWRKITRVSDDGLHVFITEDIKNQKCSHFAKKKEEEPAQYIARNGCYYIRSNKSFNTGITAYSADIPPKKDGGRMLFWYPELVCSIRYKPPVPLTGTPCEPRYKEARVTLEINGCVYGSGPYKSLNDSKTIQWPVAEVSLGT